MVARATPRSVGSARPRFCGGPAGIPGSCVGPQPGTHEERIPGSGRSLAGVLPWYIGKVLIRVWVLIASLSNRQLPQPLGNLATSQPRNPTTPQNPISLHTPPIHSPLPPPLSLIPQRRATIPDLRISEKKFISARSMLWLLNDDRWPSVKFWPMAVETISRVAPSTPVGVVDMQLTSTWLSTFLDAPSRHTASATPTERTGTSSRRPAARRRSSQEWAF